MEALLPTPYPSPIVALPQALAKSVQTVSAQVAAASVVGVVDASCDPSPALFTTAVSSYSAAAASPFSWIKVFAEVEESLTFSPSS